MLKVLLLGSHPSCCEERKKVQARVDIMPHPVTEYVSSKTCRGELFLLFQLVSFIKDAISSALTYNADNTSLFLLKKISVVVYTVALHLHRGLGFQPENH